MPVGADGAFTVRTPPGAAVTVTTVAWESGSPASERVPERAPFPLPFDADFASQAVDAPARLLSSAYGYFEVAESPDGSGRVARQAVPANPAQNRWTHRENGLPFATLPSGTNWANYNVSTSVLLPESGAGRVCGRVPLFQPTNLNKWGGLERCSVGLCLSLWQNGKWEVTEVATRTGSALPDGCPVLAQGTVELGDGWWTWHCTLRTRS